EGNLKDLFLGFTDLDLTELGHTQAALAASFFQDVPVDKIYSSDLKRAYHTALHTARAKGLDVHACQGMREIFAGQWEGKSFPELRLCYPESFATWEHDFGACRCDGGESIAELRERICRTVTEIAEANPGKTVLVFSHATPIRMIKGWGDGVSLNEMNEVPWPSNASVTRAEYENGILRVTDYSMDSFMGDLVTRLD
ncbi:MAG: histidine phosphatase family protein, partial [Clostridia bacterium]|nr:histidine phosphatase family protein [Clostridia bacterium]